MVYLNPHDEIEQTRHRLPHWSQGEVPVFVTFRLSDSLPKVIYDAWLDRREAFLAIHPEPWDDETENAFHRQFSDRIDEELDAAHGCCVLRDQRVSGIVEERLMKFHEDRYRLLSFVIMPNHVHVLFIPSYRETLPDTLKGWKGVSSRLVHREGLSDLNPFWQPDYYDRLIRGPEHFERTFRYIRENPAKAGLTSGFLYWEDQV
jgi:REP element-mobilizing transposase RayT